MSKKKKIDLHNLTPDEGRLEKPVCQGDRPGGRPYDPPEKRNEKTGGREIGIKSRKISGSPEEENAL